MSRRFFTAGCWVLIATGLVHLPFSAPVAFLAAAFACFVAALAAPGRGPSALEDA